MSVLKRLMNIDKMTGKKLFGVVAGRRLSGKSTLAGTLPGKTLVLQVGILESGSKSAEALAKQNGNDITVVTFQTIEELETILVELKADTAFDNIFIDSLSAVTEMKYNQADVQKTLKRDNWAAFREIGKSASDILLGAKSLTYPDQTKKPKNVFITIAIEIKTDANGNPIDVSLVAKGNKALSEVTKLGEAVVSVIQIETETGMQRKLLTRTANNFPGRVDNVLDQQNPGMIDANLTELLTLAGV